MYGLIGIIYACLLLYLQTKLFVWSEHDKFGSMTEKKVVILSSKDPDETPHDKTSKMGVLCMNAVVISLGI